MSKNLPPFWKKGPESRSTEWRPEYHSGIHEDGRRPIVARALDPFPVLRRAGGDDVGAFEAGRGEPMPSYFLTTRVEVVTFPDESRTK